MSDCILSLNCGRKDVAVSKVCPSFLPFFKAGFFMKVGIVGCGNIAKTHVWALNQMEDIQIAGFADTELQKAEKISEEYSCGKVFHPNAYNSLESMIKNEKLDAVHICTPHYLHVPQIIQVVKAGIAAFSEKPPAISIEEFENLEKVSEKNCAKIGFCFQNRYNKTVTKAKQIINSGEIGELIGARAFVTWRRDEDYYKTDWKGKISTEGGGVLINQAIHTLDLLLYFLGKPEKVEASVHNHHLKGKIEVEDTVEAWMTFDKGRRACFYASNAYICDAPVILELECQNGIVSVMDKCILLRKKESLPEMIYVNQDEKKAVGKDYWGNGHLECIRDFYDSFLNGKKFQNNLEGVKTTMQTMMKIYEQR